MSLHGSKFCDKITSTIFTRTIFFVKRTAVFIYMTITVQENYCWSTFSPVDYFFFFVRSYNSVSWILNQLHLQTDTFPIFSLSSNYSELLFSQTSYTVIFLSLYKQTTGIYNMYEPMTCHPSHSWAYLPNPATQWTATQQPGSSLNLVLSRLIHSSMTSPGGGFPSSNCQSCKINEV